MKPTRAGQCCARAKAALGRDGPGWEPVEGPGGLAGWDRGAAAVSLSDSQGGNGLIHQRSSLRAAPDVSRSQAGLFSSIRLRELGEMRAGSCYPVAHAARDESLEATKARRAIPRAAPAQHPQLMPFAACS